MEEKELNTPPPVQEVDESQELANQLAENSPLKNINLQQGEAVETPTNFTEEPTEEINTEDSVKYDFSEPDANWESFVDYDESKYSNEDLFQFNESYKYAQEKGGYTSKSEFYDEVVKSQSNRKAFYKSLNEDFDGMPSYEDFSRALLIDEKDEEKEPFEIEQKSQLELLKLGNNKYQELKKKDPQAAEEYWRETMALDKNAMTEAYFINKKVDEFQEYNKNTGGSYASMNRKKREALGKEYLPVESIPTFNAMQDVEEAKESYLANPNKFSENKYNELLRKYEETVFNEASATDEWASTLGDTKELVDNVEVITAEQLIDLYKDNLGEEEAYKKAEEILDAHSPSDLIGLEGDSVLKAEVGSLIENSRNKVIERTESKAFNFTNEQLDEATDNAPDIGVPSNIDPRYSTMSAKERFVMTYDIANDRLKELESIQGEEVEGLDFVMDSVNPFEDDSVSTKILNLKNWLRKNSELRLLNRDNLNTGDRLGFINTVAGVRDDLEDSFTEATLNIINSDIDVTSKKDVLYDAVQENPQELQKAATDKFKESADYYFDTQGKEGKERFVDRERMLTDPTFWTDMGANTSIMMAELVTGSAVLGAVSKTGRATRILNKLGNSNFVKLNRALSLAEKSGRLKKYGLIGKLYKYNPKLAYHAVQAGKSGLNYQAAGILFNESQEMNVASGVLGYGGSYLGGKIGNALNKRLKNVIPKVSGFFGKDSEKVLKAISRVGEKINANEQYKRLGTGFSEVFEEEGQNIANIIINSEGFGGFYNDFKAQYGDLGSVGKRALASYIAGSLLGGTALGESFISDIDKLTVEARNSLENTRGDIKKKQEALADLKKIEEFKKNAERTQEIIVDDVIKEERILEDEQGINEDNLSDELDNKAEKEKAVVEKTEAELDKKGLELLEESDRITKEGLDNIVSEAKQSLEANRDNNEEQVDVTGANKKPLNLPKGIQDTSTMLQVLEDVQSEFNNGEPLSASIDKAAEANGVPRMKVKEFISQQLEESSPSKELEELKEEVQLNKEEGVPTDIIGTKVVRNTPRGVQEVGTLKTKDGNVYFVRGKKSNKKAIKIDSIDNASNKTLSEYGLSKTNKEGVQAADVSDIENRKSEIVEEKYFNERRAFDKFSDKINELKKQRDNGSITAAEYENKADNELKKIRGVIPDIQSKIETDTDLESFNDALLASRDKGISQQLKAMEVAKKPFIQSALKEERVRAKENKKKLKENISSIKEERKQKAVEIEKQKADLERKRKESKKAEDNYNNAYGEPLNEMFKDDGSVMSEAEVKEEFEKAVEAKDTAKIIAAIKATPVGGIDIDTFGSAVNAVNNDPISQGLLADAFSRMAFDTPTPINQNQRYSNDYSKAKGVLPIIGNRKGTKGLVWIANKIGLGRETKNKVIEFTSVGGLMNNMHPDLFAELQYYKDDLILNERKATDAIAELQKLIDSYKKDNGIDKRNFELEEKVNDALKGISYDGVPQEIVQKVKDMQEMVDNFSSQLSELGLIDEGAFAQMQDDGTFYMTSTYKRDYKNGDWSKKFEEGLKEGKFDAARNLIREQYVESNADNFNSKTEEEQGQYVDDKLRGISFSPKQLMEININMDALAASNKNLRKRKDIDEAIQEVMGIEKSPYVNFVNTIANQSKILEGYKRQEALIKYGLDNGLIEEIPTGDIKQKIGEAERKGWVIPKKAPPSLYGDKVYSIQGDFYDAINAYGDSIEAKEENKIMSAWRKTVSFQKKLNTAYSPASHMSNIAGALSTVLSNGHINPSFASEGFKTAIQGTWLGDRMRVKNVDTTFKDAMTQYGIMDSGMSAEISNTLRKAKEGLSPEQYKSIEGKLGSGKVEDILSAMVSLSKNTGDGFMTVYQMVDNIARAIGFTNEVAFAAEMSSEFKAMQDPSKSRVENIREFIKTEAGRKAMAEAKSKVDATYPTYSKVPRGLRWIAENTPFGTFVSFPAESMRTSYNMMALGFGEIMQSSKDTSLDERQKSLLKKKGYKRITSALAVQTGFALIGKLSASLLLGFKGDEEESVRKLLPEWYKNSNLMFYKNSEGDIQFIDFDRYNSYGLPIGILKLLFKGEFMEAAAETVKPYGSLNMTVQTSYEILQGETVNGAKIRNERDGFLDNTLSSIAHLGKSSGSVIKFGNKMWKAQFGEGKDYNGEDIPYHDYFGDEISVWDETIRLFGVSKQKIKLTPERMLSRERRDYIDNRKLLNRIKSKQISYEGNIDRVNKIHKSIIEDMREKYQGAFTLNNFSDKSLTSEELNSAIGKSGGLSRDEFEEQVVLMLDKIYDIDEEGNSYFKEIEE